jgi:Na+-translocating ferredoxin:NAD+ oxidoreductase RnfD subunit
MFLKGYAVFCATFFIETDFVTHELTKAHTVIFLIIFCQIKLYDK